jgi:hypothetical protein
MESKDHPQSLFFSFSFKNHVIKKITLTGLAGYQVIDEKNVNTWPCEWACAKKRLYKRLLLALLLTYILFKIRFFVKCETSNLPRCFHDN